MDNTKFIEFVEANTEMVRKESGRRAVKEDPENTRLAAVRKIDCQYCDEPVVNQVIYMEKRWTAYKQEPYWKTKCANCKKVLHQKY